MSRVSVIHVKGWKLVLGLLILPSSAAFMTPSGKLCVLYLTCDSHVITLASATPIPT